MPYKDREQQLAAMRKNKLQHRPRPNPQGQANGALPPYGIMIFDDDGERVQCHACGRFLRAMNRHLKTHNLNADSYKATYGLARTLSLLPPQTQAAYRQRALDLNLGAALAPWAGKATQPKMRSWRLGSRIKESKAKQGTYQGRQRQQTEDS